MFDTPQLPLTGGTLVACAAYSAVSLLVTGPIVGERTIEKAGWSRQCEAGLEAEITAQRPAPRIIPRTDCQSILGGWMPELGRLCRDLGNPDFGGPAADLLREQERLRQEAEEQRVANAAARSGTRCSCAAAVFVEEQRLSLALYAGSARLITPAPIKDLQSELTRALHGPACVLTTK